MTDVELHTDEAHSVIAAELVACTLGHRSRPELRMDPLGILVRFARQFNAFARRLVAGAR